MGRAGVIGIGDRGSGKSGEIHRLPPSGPSNSPWVSAVDESECECYSSSHDYCATSGPL